MTDFERLGGLPGIEALVRAYVDRFFDDFVIGFLFEGKDRERIVRHETAFAAAHFGAEVIYRGRGLRQTHKPLKINAGHFRRRLALVRTVLLEHEVPGDLVERWVETEQRFEDTITNGTDCL